MNIDRENHPAVVAGRISREAVAERDKQRWLDNFAPTATVEDPVGPSMFDPEGIGFTGPERISEFWDKAVASSESLEFVFDDEVICGNEVAYIGKVVAHVAGYVSESQGVFTYRVDETGKLVALRAFWEVEKAMKSARPA